MQPEAWSDVVGESEKDVLESTFCVNGNQLLLSYLSDVKYVLQIWDLQSGCMLHNLPIDIGSLDGISGRRKYKEIFIGFTSFLTPGIIYQCNLDAEKPELHIRASQIPTLHSSTLLHAPRCMHPPSSLSFMSSTCLHLI